MYKAITILQAAKEAEDQLGRPVVPVFWIAGEDHDFDEVNHVQTLSSKLEIDRIKLDAPGGARTSVSRSQIADWEPVLEALEASLMDTEFKPELVGRLREFANHSATLTDFFARMMGWLFGERGLVLLDSDDPELRLVEAPMFDKLLDGQHAFSLSLEENRAEVEALGFEPQAEIHEDCVNLFLFDEETGERYLLYRTENGYADRKGGHRMTGEELKLLLDRSPQSFSNNVMTRPLMQDFLFPVLATVLGPGEISYWGLLCRGFAAFSMEMPILLPRNRHTLVEGTVRKHMQKYDLDFDAVFESFEARKEDWLKEQDEIGLEARFDEAKEKFRQLYNPIIDAVSEINPGMRKLGDVNLLKILEQMEFLEARATDAHRSQYEASIRQLDRIKLSLHPQNKPQERVYNVVAFLNKYGKDWLLELTDHKPEAWGTHRVVYL